jgi:nicotinate-nucleotide pyrophosphorylase (carboxylating)
MAAQRPGAAGVQAAPLLQPAAVIVARDVRRALAEDVGSGDLTAQLLPARLAAQARVITRDAALVCGSAWFGECFTQTDPAVEIDWLVAEATPVAAGAPICRLRGPARALVTAERTALNFLQTLSATASVTARYVEAVRGTRAVILDTRKTLPGLREAQKYAVRAGGGSNHRMGLHDAVLIKENHIAAAGSITAALGQARALNPGVLIETEVETFGELREALDAGADRILLDEFDLDELARAVREAGGRVPLEVSGGVSLERVRAIADTGVDYISVGALTKHVHAIDLSMRIELAPT